jgi:hypothetical protein
MSPLNNYKLFACWLLCSALVEAIYFVVVAADHIGPFPRWWSLVGVVAIPLLAFGAWAEGGKKIAWALAVMSLLTACILGLSAVAPEQSWLHEVLEYRPFQK